MVGLYYFTTWLVVLFSTVAVLWYLRQPPQACVCFAYRTRRKRQRVFHWHKDKATLTECDASIDVARQLGP